MKEDTSRTSIFRMLAVLMMAVVVGFLALAGNVWREYRNTIMDQEKKQLLLTEESIARTLEVTIQRNVADLERLCVMIEDTQLHEEQQDILGTITDSYIREYDNFITGILLETSEGILNFGEDHVEIQQILGVSHLEHEIVFQQALGTDGQVYFLLKKKISDGKTVSLIMNAGEYHQSLVSDIRLGEHGYIVVKNSKGILLMHPVKAQLGKDAVEDRKSAYGIEDLSSLEQMLKQQYQGKTGVQEYSSYWWEQEHPTLVRKLSAFTPVYLGDDFLIVSAVMDYNDIYAPITTGIRRMILIISLLFLVILAVIGAWGKLLLQRQRDTEEIAYLKELNEVLQKMKRSEETVAHQQRLQIMGTMTGGIAHEFNNLLTPIMGYADILMMELPENSEEYENASEIYDAAEKAKEMIQQLSALSRRNMETAFHELSLRQVLIRSLKIVRCACPVNVHLEEELDDMKVLGNQTQINQVLLNICVNAIHAIGEKEGTIQIRCSSISSQMLKERHSMEEMPEAWPNYACIEIQDNGCGMSSETMKQIFDPFFTTKRNGKGIGLGLALVEQIISSHKGYIFVESQLGKGSCFFLYLPILERGEDIRKKEGFPAHSDHKMRILIVHSNAKVLRILEKNFTKIGFLVFTGTSLEEARACLSEQEFVILAVESHSSGIQGIEFCMSIHGMYGKMVRLLLTDKVTKEILEARQREIIDGYVESPPSVVTILEAAQKKS